MTRYFLDTEFNEDGSTIKLISIALVSEDGEELYRVLTDGWRAEDCNPWVQQNVLPHLPPRGWSQKTKRMESVLWKPRSTVRQEIIELLRPGKQAVEIWTYFGSYDWVAFCQLFGCMVDLPRGMPMFVMDIRAEMARLSVTKDQLPVQVGTQHDALEDARWNLAAWKKLCEIEQQRSDEAFRVAYASAKPGDFF